MSYILEALKDSQKNRDEKDVPDLRTIHPPPEANGGGGKSGKAGVIFGILFLAVLAGVGGWWFGGFKPAEQAPATVAENTVSPAAPAITTQQAESTQPAEPAMTDEPAVADAGIVRSIPAEDPITEINSTEFEARVTEEVADTAEASRDTGPPPVVEEPAPEITEPEAIAETRSRPAPSEEEAAEKVEDITQQQVASVNRPEQSAGEAAGSTDSVPARPESAEPAAAVPEETAAADGETPATSATPAEVVAAVETGAEPETSAPRPEQERVPHFREMPFEIQKQVGEIRYSVHLYSPTPARRMVKIDGLVRREGDSIRSGLVLEEITADGAVFTYRDYRFRMPVN